MPPAAPLARRPCLLPALRSVALQIQRAAGAGAAPSSTHDLSVGRQVVYTTLAPGWAPGSHSRLPQGRARPVQLGLEAAPLTGGGRLCETTAAA